ncbi:MAG: NADH-quinone oxidoreductase subunit NuoH [Chthoniobacterales bacterium]|nr:NADH-quinone oxidoreductase subunit NuoH [Chthoniobacterales bacterium]
MIEELPTRLYAWFLQLLQKIGLPSIIVDIVGAFLIAISTCAVFLALFALTSVLERKILARVQNRLGPNRVGPFGLLQPVADGIKMLIKEDIIPHNADKILHFLAPVLALIPSLLVLAILPYGSNLVPVNLNSGLLYYFAISAIAEIAIFLAGWAGNNKYSVLGAMRAIAQILSYELPLATSALCVALAAGSLSLPQIVQSQNNYLLGLFPNWFLFTPWGLAAGLVFFIAALAETNRSPFDLPEGESELVAGHLTEYSGFKYATFFIAEYVGMFAICALFVTLFLGGWLPPLPFLAFIPSWIWFFAKVCFIAFVMIWIRATLPRMRIDHLLSFAWKFLLPLAFSAFFALLLWHYLGRNILSSLLSFAFIVAAYFALGYPFTQRYSPRKRTYLFSE